MAQGVPAPAAPVRHSLASGVYLARPAGGRHPRSLPADLGLAAFVFGTVAQEFYGIWARRRMSASGSPGSGASHRAQPAAMGATSSTWILVYFVAFAGSAFKVTGSDAGVW